MFSGNSRDIEGVKIYKKLCEEFKVNANAADAATLKEMINSYMKNEDNLVSNAELSVRRSYFSYKLQQEVQALPDAIADDLLSINLHKKLCEELHINESEADAAALKEIINSYMKENSNLSENDIERVRGLYFSHKMQEQVQAEVVAISNDGSNPLKDLTNHAEIIANYLKKIASEVGDITQNYLEDKFEFNKEYLKKIFKDEELPAVLYILNNCPLIVKDDKDNYNFVYTGLVKYLHRKAIFNKLSDSTFDQKDKDRLNQMLRR